MEQLLAVLPMIEAGLDIPKKMQGLIIWVKCVTVQPSEVLRRAQVNASTEHSDETLPRAELLQKEEPAEKIQVEEVKPAVEAETTKAAAKAEAKP
jgi:hypothetical protein